MAGTTHGVVRVYNVQTGSCYINESTSQHTEQINALSYSADGKMFASCSADGKIKLWDGVSMSNIATIDDIKAEVTSVQLSKNSKYLLSASKDGYVRLYDLSNGAPIFHLQTGNPTEVRTQALFSHNEDFIYTTNSSPTGYIFDTRTHQQVASLDGHLKPIKSIATSPTDNSIITCSLDNRARFWHATEY